MLIFTTYHLNRWKGGEVRQDVGAFVLMSVIAVLAPILAAQLAHWVPVPLVVFEIVLGLLLGPQGFGSASTASSSTRSPISDWPR